MKRCPQQGEEAAVILCLGPDAPEQRTGLNNRRQCGTGGPGKLALKSEKLEKDINRALPTNTYYPICCRVEQSIFAYGRPCSSMNVMA